MAAFLTHKNSLLRRFLRELAKEETAEAIYSGEKIKTFLNMVSKIIVCEGAYAHMRACVCHT